MTQEDKELLLKDLLARLPYGFTIHRYSDNCNIVIESNGIDEFAHFIEYSEGEDFKPYLRPMSSMTEEEKKDYDSFLFDNLERENVIGYEDKAFGVDVIMRYRSWQVVQWLLKHHLDFNGLIDVYGLALKAPEGMYNIK